MEEPTREQIDASTGPTLLEFGATWCGFCQAAQPDIAAVMRSHPGVRHLRIEDGKGLFANAVMDLFKEKPLSRAQVRRAQARKALAERLPAATVSRTPMNPASKAGGFIWI